ncbi:MAG: hypothetical protein U0X39_00415 [Bacteroidales bacterium]
MKNTLATFPGPLQLESLYGNVKLPFYRNANGHIHTPFSFSAFSSVDEAFILAEKEKIDVLGINDFYVTDGYADFYDNALKHSIFPLFNIEFIGLLVDEQKSGTRINDPNNPGRIYFCGKGLDFPFHLEESNRLLLDSVKQETQSQLQAMTVKLSSLVREVNDALVLNFDDIKRKYARELVRERHLAKALRIIAEEAYSNSGERKLFYRGLFGNTDPKSGMNDASALENEIRSKLLKAGGKAFVEEDVKSFLGLDIITAIIKDAGGIPCYPVLLDDPSGKCTEFESDPEKLYSKLVSAGVNCIELIPGRNDARVLEEFVSFFDKKGFIVTFGTEHNAPEMIPLTVTARGGVSLNNYLSEVNWKGVCTIAAHQYLRANNREGFTASMNTLGGFSRGSFARLGQLVIEHYLRTFRK